uniref:Nuclear pore complex protein Nup153 n=1 Tax=Callorhinchus milii TaxID=7868 RepID=A0A4W3HNR8_CALMI
VPGWLQKYFGHANKPGETRNDEPAELIDDRDNQIPVNETPQYTNKSALNFSEMLLIRPALSRSHFNCAALDTSAHDSQPSTSSSFPIGSSGFSLVKEVKDSASLHEDDNISTTSGFSSRASDKDVTTSRNPSLPPLWSPEADRFHLVSQQPTASLKKPSFNLSAFGGSSPSFGSTSLLNSSQLGDSPFYPGKTTYGGAAAATKNSRVRATPYQAPIRRQMKAKPASSPSYGVTSATARRILQSLEKMSSPLAPFEKTAADVIDWQSKFRKMDAQPPPVQKLQTPKFSSGATNRSMFFKPSLTPGGHTNRPVFRLFSCVYSSNNSCLYNANSSPATNGLTSGGAGGKMRREKDHYSARGYRTQEVEVPELPEVSLPIKTAALPVFNFGSPSTAASPITPILTKSLSDKAVMSSPSNVAFTFSTPNIKATDSKLQPVSLSVINCTLSVAASPFVPAPVNKRKDETCDGPFKPAKTLKQGSVLDILKGPGEYFLRSRLELITQVETKTVFSSESSTGTFGFGEKFKPPEGAWQCDTCLLQNKGTHSKCIACQTAKATSKTAPPPKRTDLGFGNSKTIPPVGSGGKFKPAAGMWDCDTCLVQNKADGVKCVACETPKPGTGVKPVLTLPATTESTKNTSANPSSTGTGLSLADEFKKPEGAWSCDVCLLQNKTEDSKCVACQSPKPGVASGASTVPVSAPAETFAGFGDKFKKPEGSWSCEACLVQNTSNVSKCIACQSAKPGSKTEFKGSAFSALSSVSSSPFKFGIQSSATDPSQTNKITGGLKFGDKGGFKLGNQSDVSGGIKFEAAGGIKFGNVSKEQPLEESKKDNTQTSSSGFKFGFSVTTGNQASTVTKFGAAEANQQDKKDETNEVVFGGFKFGSSGTSAKSEDKGVKGGYTFGSEDKKESQFVLGKQEEKKEATAVSEFGFGNPMNKDSVAASPFLFRKAAEKKDSLTSAPFMFGKRKQVEEAGSQSDVSFKTPEKTKEVKLAPMFDSSKQETKSGFTFNLAEKSEPAESVSQGFLFGPAVNASEQGAVKPTFNLFGNTSSSSTATNPGVSKPSSIFGSSASASTTPFLFRQTNTTAGSTSVGSGSESTVPAPKPFLFGSQEVKPTPTTSSIGAPPAPFSFGSTPSNSNTTSSVFAFRAPATTSNSTGKEYSMCQRIPSNPPAFGTSQAPAFGQSTNQPPAAFGSSTAPTFPFLTGCPPSAFSSQSTSSQPSLFGGQLSNQPPSFGSTSSTTSSEYM